LYYVQLWFSFESRQTNTGYHTEDINQHISTALCAKLHSIYAAQKTTAHKQSWLKQNISYLHNTAW